ncbi:MAG: ABC transporter permease [Rhizobiaceae bacterium]|nr:ABC transporter permease [Rhizobiaceae bacterium]
MGQDIPRAFRLLAAPAALFSFALFLAPLLLMLSLAFRDPQPGLQNFGWMATSSAVGKIVWATFRFSAIASVISVMLGFAVAYAIWLSGRTLSLVLLFVVLVSFWLSVLIRCFALILALGPNGPVNATLAALSLGPVRLIRNEPGVLLGMVHYLIPFAVLTILAALRGIDLSLVAAARSMGAHRARVFRTVVLPLAAPGAFAALALTFVIALGFYITPALLGGGRVVMIAEFITFHVQNVLAWGKASALAIFLIAAIGASYGLVKLPEMLMRQRRAA